MNEDLKVAKQELRRQMYSFWRRITQEDRAAASASAIALLRGRPEWQRARKVMMYAPLKDELDIWPLFLEAIEAGQVAALPRFVRTKGVYEPAVVRDVGMDIVLGVMGIREPGPVCPSLPFSDLDMMLVPGLGFDRCGNRLGRGKGCYDHILSNFKGSSCGVAMDWQVLPSVPVTEHDRRVSFVLTPTRWIQCTRTDP